MTMRTNRRHSLTILAIYVATSVSHSSAKRGWSRHVSYVRSEESLQLQRSINSSTVHGRRHHLLSSVPSLSLRGGSSAQLKEDHDAADDNDGDVEAMRRQKSEDYEKLVKYRTEQQMLYQLRSTYLTEMLAARGVPLPTIASVSTADGERPPERVDWDCALSTGEDPKSCLYSFDAEPDTKVVAPLGTDQWISLSALNRLRRTDPTKVEPMWHSRFSILRSWFSDESEFSMLQHVGVKGFFVSSVLLDGGNGMVLRSLLILSGLSAIVLLMPLLEYIIGRILVSAPFWAQWTTWGRVLRAGFPLKLLIGQLVWKAVASCFSKIENEVKDYIVDLECEILEDSVPVTVGVGSEEGTPDEYDEYDDDY